MPLVAGSDTEVAAVRRIFELYVRQKLSCYEVARRMLARLFCYERGWLFR